MMKTRYLDEFMRFLAAHRILKMTVCAGVTAGLIGIPTASIPTPVDAVFPGYNGEIYFYSSRDGNTEAYSILPDGTNATNLTQFPSAGDFDYSCAPGTSKCLFGSDRDGDRDIYLINEDGSLQNLTNNTSFDNGARWSRDGNSILFQTTRDGNNEIYVMNADGSNAVNLSNDPTTDFEPDWSPDGMKIVFSRWQGPEANLFIMDSNGANQTRITTDLTKPGTDNKASWSPDGSKIVFASNRDGSGEIYLVNADGTGRTQLTNDGFADTEPTWSPDGTKIVYRSTRNGVWQLFSMKPDGSEQTDLEPGDIFGGGPVWHSIPNTAPTASNDVVTVGSNISTSIDVLVNDTDEEALDPANLTITTPPFNGTAEVVEGRIKYTPNTGFNGSDQLTYRICDAFELDQKCATGVLSITVQAPSAPTLTVGKVGENSYHNGTTKYTSTSARPTFSGTATPGSTIRVEIHSDPIVLTTTANGAGEWSVTPSADLPAGEHTVYISATLNGVTTELGSLVLGISETIPNTGSSITGLRYGGLALCVLGFGLAATSRRRSRRFATSVPPLFPSA